MAIPLTLSNVPDETPYIQYVANNGQTVYPYPFPITQDSDLVVVINGVRQSTDAGYSLSGQGNDTGGNVTLNSGSTAGDIVTLYRDVQIERLTQFAQNGGFSSSAFNAEFNNLYLIAQQLQAAIAQCLQIPSTNNPAPLTSLTPGAYANKYLAFDSNGNPVPALLTSSGTLTSAIIASLLNTLTTSAPTADKLRTAAEIAAGVTPSNYAYSPTPWLQVRREGCVLDGATDDSVAFNRCLSVASTANMSMVIDAPCYLNSNITIPQNVQLVFVGNGKLKPGSGKTITLNQTPQAGLWQIFDYSSGGTIVFGALGRTTEVWGEWWGANGDGVTNVANEVPINAALVSIWNGGSSFGGTVRLGAGLFFISSTIVLQNYTSIRGLNDWSKIKAKSSGWSPSSVMITAINGTSPMFDSRLEYLTIDANSVANIQLVIETYAWQQRCGIYFCEILNFAQTGLFYAHGYGGAAVMELVSTDFFPNDVNGAVGAYFTGDGTVGWTKLNVRNCTFASGGVNATIGLWVDSRFVCTIEGLDVEELQYGVVLGNGAVLTGAGLSGGGQLPAVSGNAIVRCLGTWTGPTAGNVNVIGVQLGGWRNMLTDQNRAYACSALNPYDGHLVWPPNLSRPQGGCQVTGGATPALVDSYGVVAGGSIVHTATGEQTITLGTSMDTSGDIVCKVTSNDPGATQIVANVTSATTIQIFTKSPLGVAIDAASFVLDVFHTT